MPEGTTVAYYTGKLLDSVHGLKSEYLCESKFKGKKKYLDAADVNNAAGRLLNDACDLYDHIKVRVYWTLTRYILYVLSTYCMNVVYFTHIST